MIPFIDVKAGVKITHIWKKTDKNKKNLNKRLKKLE